MAYSAKILADSVNSCGNRLTTFEITFPRMVLSEFNTHRALSRNSASSRAIPIEKQIDRILMDPFIPIHWGKNQKGMVAEHELSEDEKNLAIEKWLVARDNAVRSAKDLSIVGVHKQITNRVLEPFMWHTVIVSATEYENFFNLRCHPDAQPEIQKIAMMMRELYVSSAPILVPVGEWHLPLIFANEDLEGYDVKKVCAGRCARVSYLTHDGRRAPEEDVSLCNRLLASGHASPLEHVAQSMDYPAKVGNFTGWFQYRKMILGEDVFQPK